MMGDQAAARKSYEDFLILRKDVDADIPIYQQAKAEYAKLRRSLNRILTNVKQADSSRIRAEMRKAVS
jgi:hypothetical protein